MTEENNIPAAEEQPAVVADEPTPAPVVEPAVAVETPAQPEPVAEVIAVPEPQPISEPVVETPAPAAKKNPVNIASGNDADDIYLANCVYKNKFARKSLTVHHLQRRLNELGYKDAYSDKDGWLGDLTRLAIESFQKDKGLNATGDVDADTFTKIFEGDPHVIINL